MNEKALKTLEYYKIIDMLEAFATSSIGKNKCRQLRPLDNPFFTGKCKPCQSLFQTRDRK